MLKKKFSFQIKQYKAFAACANIFVESRRLFHAAKNTQSYVRLLVFREAIT
jgi:hypothetical protein